MRSVVGLFCHRLAFNTSGQLAANRGPAASAIGQLTSVWSGSKRGSDQDRANKGNNSRKQTSGTSKSSKRMADLLKERTVGSGAAGDKVSSDKVKHDRTSKRFTLDLGNNQLARIDYRTIGPEDRIEMYHSEVPEQLRGRGLGKALAVGALELAARENMRVKLTCTYLIDFVNNKCTDQQLKRTIIAGSDKGKPTR